jgi:uncharacterized protein
MDNYFFDSSAVVKRYNSEIGTNWVLQIYRPSSNNIIHIAQITLVEVIAALTRRAKVKSQSSGYTKSVKRFERDIKDRFSVFKINDSIISQAMKLAVKYGLRGYDAVQLASALYAEKELSQLNLSPLIFVSADNELNNAAKIEGLTVENPNNYP